MRPFPEEELEVYAEEAQEMARGLGFDGNAADNDGRAWRFWRYPDHTYLVVPTEPSVWAAFLAMARDALRARGEAMA